MKRIVVVVALAAVLVGLVGASLAAAAPPPQKPPTANQNPPHYATSDQIPFDALSESPCTGEVIQITGTLHIVNQFTAVQDGYHVVSHFNVANARGVGLTTGDEYVIAGPGNTVENFLPTHGMVGGNVVISMIISKGSEPNQNGFSRVHYILDETGMTKAEFAKFHFKCTGPGGPTFPMASASASAAATPTATAKAQSRP